MGERARRTVLLGQSILAASRLRATDPRQCAPQNVIGQAPVFNEVFIDEGDVDMAKSIKAYKDAGFTGVMTPDHTPSVSAP
eukprot:COSAG04_NODE_8718_length_939_cov_1.166667_1_plen_81_part_00